MAAQTEDRLLLSAARAYFRPQAAPLLRSIVQGRQDWQSAIEKADAHGLLPILLRQVENTCPDIVPPAALETMRRGFNENSMRVLLMTCELIRLLKLLETQGIRAVPYKGPALAALLYGDLSMRRSDDLDVLIPKQDIWRASDLLESQGYHMDPPIRRHQLPAYSRSECDLTFRHISSNLRIELHWAFVPPYHGSPIETGQLWDRLEAMELLGRTIPVPSREDLLLGLCLHGSKHMWNRLEWICGLAALLSGGRPMDWDTILRQARSCAGERHLLLGLLLAHELLEADLPIQVRSTIPPSPAIAWLVKNARRELFSGSPADFLRLTEFRLRLIGNLRGRIRYCVHRALLPSYKDLGWLQLPTPLYFLYFLLRPIRLAVARLHGD